MKHKYFIGFFAIFLIVASFACVYAAEATFDSMKFDVPEFYTQTSSNNTTIVLENGDGKIIITNEIIGEDAVNSYMESKGFTFSESAQCDRTFTGTQSGKISYVTNTYNKTNGMAVANFLTKDNKNFTVMAINNNYDSEFDDFETSDLNVDADAIIKELMLS